MNFRTVFIAAGLSLLASVPVVAGWVPVDNGRWQYEEDGSIVTSRWIEDQGDWYYVGDDGIMLANTGRTIDGIDYRFDSSGKWMESANLRTGVIGNRYYNEKYRFSVDIPDGVTYEVDANGFINLENQFMFMSIANFSNTEGASTAESIKFLTEFFLDENGSSMIYAGDTDMQFGGIAFTRSHTYDEQYGFSLDFYTAAQDDGFIAIVVGYAPSCEAVVESILNSFARMG